jgi:hypothetical protein
LTDLSHEELKILLDYDPETGLFTWKDLRYKHNEVAGTDRDGYITIYIKGKNYLAHRLAWFYFHGTWPTTIVDHRNTIVTDNRIDNLRESSKSQNGMNRGVQINNMLGVKGVSPSGNKYVARIGINRITYYLGTFDTIEEAINARREAEIEYFGEFANTGKAEAR